MKRIKKDGLITLLFFTQTRLQPRRKPVQTCMYRKVITKTENTQQDKVLQINKTQKHEEEAAGTGIIIARIC